MKRPYWRFHIRDDRKIAQKVREGKIDIITGTGWGFFDLFFGFLYILGFFKVISEIEGKGYQRKLLTITKLILTYSVKVLLGIGSMNQIPQLLFKEVGLLKLIGFDATQIKEGICKRGKGKSRPMHKNTLADFSERLSLEEAEYILNEAVKLLAKYRFIKDRIYIMDATDIETTERCRGAGVKSYREKKWSKKEKRVVEIEYKKYGFKIIVLQGVKSRVFVSAKFVKINEHESNYTIELIEKAQENIGKDKIKILLIDNVFMDGETLWKIRKEYKIDFITKARTNMEVVKDARGLRDEVAEGVHRQKREKDNLEVIGIKGLASYDHYGETAQKKLKNKKDFQGKPINVVMVLRWKKKVYKRGEERVYLTSLAVNEPLKIFDKYELRSLIENRGFRELKQGWKLGKIPMKKEQSVRSHALLTLTIYSLNACFQTKRGKGLAEKGIRRIRLEDMHSIHKIIIFSGDYFGILDIEEYALTLRSPPQVFIRINPEEAKKRLGLEE